MSEPGASAPVASGPAASESRVGAGVTVLVAAVPERSRPGMPSKQADLRAELEVLGSAVGVAVDFRTTDDEAELIGWLHTAVVEGWGVVLDPSGFTHYSYALRDAAAAVTEAGLPLIEAHRGTPTPRDAAGQASVIASVSTGVIAGLDADSYRYAVRAAAERVAVQAARASVRR